MRGIGEAFDTDFPVYTVIAKSETIPFFPEFFRRLPEDARAAATALSRSNFPQVMSADLFLEPVTPEELHRLFSRTRFGRKQTRRVPSGQDPLPALAGVG